MWCGDCVLHGVGVRDEGVWWKGGRGMSVSGAGVWCLDELGTCDRESF